MGDWGRSPQKAGAFLTLWNEVPEEIWPFSLNILAMPVMGDGDGLATMPCRLPSFRQLWLAMAFGQSPARAVFCPISPAFGDFASFQKHCRRRSCRHLAPPPPPRIPPLPRPARPQDALDAIRGFGAEASVIRATCPQHSLYGENFYLGASLLERTTTATLAGCCSLCSDTDGCSKWAYCHMNVEGG